MEEYNYNLLEWDSLQEKSVPHDFIDPSQFDPSEFGENPLEIQKKVMQAWENWPSLSLEEKVAIARITDAIYPPPPYSLPEEILSDMEFNPYVIPPSVSHYASTATEHETWGALSRLFAKKQAKQGGNPASLEGLNFEGKDGEQAGLPDDLKGKIDAHRGKRN